MNKTEAELLYYMQRYPSVYRVVHEKDLFNMLKILKKGSKTFEELAEETLLNPRVLENYLDFLINNGFVEPLYLPNRIEYVLTGFGKKILSLKERVLSPM